MEFGLFTWFNPLRGQPDQRSFEANFREVHAAEELGWDTVWLPETHLGGDMILISSPFVLAAAVASRTTKLKVGLAIHQPRLRFAEAAADSAARDTATVPRALRDLIHIPPSDPIRTAEDAAMVDQVSGGRFIYGVGGGTGGDERRRQMFFEFLEVVKMAWRENDFAGFDGTYYQYPQMLGVTPKPFTAGGPPIVLAAESTTSFPALGALGYHLMIGAGTANNPRGHEGMKEDIASYHEAWTAAGHPGTPNIIVRIPTHVRLTKEQASEDVRETIEIAEGRYSKAGVDLPRPDPGTASIQRVGRANLFGTPDEAIERIHQMQHDLGATGVMFETNYFGGIPRAAVLESMQILTEKVMSEFPREPVSYTSRRDAPSAV